MLKGFFDAEIYVIDILCDNQSCIKLTENPVFHDKSKHIVVKYHYIWDMVQKGAVKLKYVPKEEQVADVLTKPLSHVKFEYFRQAWRSPKGPPSREGVMVDGRRMQ